MINLELSAWPETEIWGPDALMISGGPSPELQVVSTLFVQGSSRVQGAVLLVALCLQPSGRNRREIQAIWKSVSVVKNCFEGFQY